MPSWDHLVVENQGEYVAERLICCVILFIFINSGPPKFLIIIVEPCLSDSFIRTLDYLE